jgi:hypothetical protein
MQDSASPQGGRRSHLAGEGGISGHLTTPLNWLWPWKVNKPSVGIGILISEVVGAWLPEGGSGKPQVIPWRLSPRAQEVVGSSLSKQAAAGVFREEGLF